MNKTGTKEWSDATKNIDSGCRNGCRYCWAAYNAIHRFKRVENVEKWTHPTHTKEEFIKPKKINGILMFPSTHDICPENVDRCIAYLTGHLAIGNKVLIVTKPHVKVVEKMCEWLKQWKDQIVWRFTIGTLNEESRLFWEPGSTTIAERELAIQLASRLGFKTSISAEPYYDISILDLPARFMPYITNNIWIGKMNHVESRVVWKLGNAQDIHSDYWKDRMFEVSSDEFVRKIYNKFKDDPRIKWKDSIRKVMMLPGEDEVA